MIWSGLQVILAFCLKQGRTTEKKKEHTSSKTRTNSDSARFHDTERPPGLNETKGNRNLINLSACTFHALQKQNISKSKLNNFIYKLIFDMM